MLASLSAALVALTLVVIQVASLSHLPPAFASVSLVTVAMTVAIIYGRDLEAAVIALVGGILLDLHGVFGLGAELACAFAAFAVMRVLFSRFLSNANLLAVFLLALSAVLTRFALLCAVDGLRVLSGHEPFLLVLEPETLTAPVRMMLTTGIASVVVIVIGRAAERFTKRLFLSSSLTLKL